MEGNAKLQTSASVALLVGPGLGGLVAQAAGAARGVLIDAVPFLARAHGQGRARNALNARLAKTPAAPPSSAVATSMVMPSTLVQAAIGTPTRTAAEWCQRSAACDGAAIGRPRPRPAARSAATAAG